MSDPPIIDPNWLTSPTDIQVAIEAFKRSRAMAEASSAIPIQIGDEFMPGKNVTSDADIHEYIKNSAYQNWHASCTCKLTAYSLLEMVTDVSYRSNGQSHGSNGGCGFEGEGYWCQLIACR